MILECPHEDCDMIIEIVNFNCCIFRCGIYKKTFKQVDPHLSKVKCDKLGTTIYGCGRPFMYNKHTKQLEICEYK